MRIRSITSAETHDLRQRVLRPTQTIAEMEWSLDRADGSFHLGAEEDDTVVAIATFLREPCEQIPGRLQYRLRGMATVAEYQGRGIGSALLRSGLDHLRQLSADVVWCNARVGALDFYGREGFNTTGPAFMIEGIGLHHLMYRQL